MKTEEDKALKALKENPKFFYSFAKRKGTTKSRIGPLCVTVIFVDDPQGMADTLQKQFISVFSNPDNVPQPEDLLDEEKRQNESYLNDISFDVNDIIKAINEIISHSSPGDDGFPASLLKECKEHLAYPILLMWKDSLNKGFIHPMFLHQLITPIYKGKGSKCTAANYRPISLTSHLIKIFERILRNQLVDFLERNEKITQISMVSEKAGAVYPSFFITMKKL